MTASFNADESTWVGDEQDGCYVFVYEEDEQWYYTVVIDSETGSFVEDLITDIGPYGTRAEADNDGQAQAIYWCMLNGVDYDFKAPRE